jgi:hypothetical protein
MRNYITVRIQNEIKFQYKKKQQLNLQLYEAHINNVNMWQKIGSNIEQSIEQKLKQEMEKVYMKQQRKIANMMRVQTADTINNNTKHSRVENYTNI